MRRLNVNSKQPELSAILLTKGSYDEALCTLVRAWSQQTVKEQIEIVLVCPNRQDLGLAECDVAGFAGWQVVEIGEYSSTSVARTAGIRAATAPVVAFTEDHSFPNCEWAEVIIDRHREGWTGVGRWSFAQILAASLVGPIVLSNMVIGRTRIVSAR